MKKIFTLILLNICLFSFGQVTFTNVPINKQLVARDLTTNLGTVTISGSVNSNGVNYNAIQIEILRSGAAYNIFTENLNFNGNTATFEIDVTIASELANFTVFCSTCIYSKKRTLKW